MHRFEADVGMVKMSENGKVFYMYYSIYYARDTNFKLIQINAQQKSLNYGEIGFTLSRLVHV